MKRLCALALICALAAGITLIGLRKAPEEKPAADSTQSSAVKTSPAKGSTTATAGP